MQTHSRPSNDLGPTSSRTAGIGPAFYGLPGACLVTARWSPRPEAMDPAAQGRTMACSFRASARSTSGPRLRL